MPGGLIVVYEGILPVTQDEASLAIVLGHEIAHAVALNTKKPKKRAWSVRSITISPNVSPKIMKQSITLISKRENIVSF
jgi:predicted Zn-dependent protease